MEAKKTIKVAVCNNIDEQKSGIAFSKKHYFR